MPGSELSCRFVVDEDKEIRASAKIS